VGVCDLERTSTGEPFYGGGQSGSKAVRKVLHCALLGFLIGGAVVVGATAQAQVLRLDYQTKQAGGSLRRGPVEVKAQHSRRINESGMNVIQPVVVVRVNGVEVGRLSGAEKVGGPATVVQLAEMDPANPFPEVLLSSFTGGAHCCNQIQVLSSDADGGNWREVTLGPFDGGPSPAEDPLRDGRFLIVDVDNRFLYRFDCYACSTAPARVWQLQGDRFVDVTHRPEFVPLHRRNLQRMARWFQEKSPNSPNGFLAGYVANKALVGELYDGWDRMIQRYDSASDWGLKECKGNYDEQGNCIGREVAYGSFPEALRAFLVESGYITPTGQQ
jgi:hypothetical protein